MFVAFDHHVDGKLLKCFVTRCRNLTYQRIPAAKEDLEDLEDDKGLKDHSDRIKVGWSNVWVTRRARRRGGKPRWLSHSRSCTCSP